MDISIDISMDIHIHGKPTKIVTKHVPVGEFRLTGNNAITLQPTGILCRG